MSFANFSWMCYVDKKTKDFVENMNPLIKEVKKEIEYRRSFDTTQVWFWCIYCMQEQKKEVYLQARTDDPSKPTPHGQMEPTAPEERWGAHHEPGQVHLQEC